jgi:hypothetical protein
MEEPSMPRIRFAAAGLVLAALTLAACGGDPDQPAPPAAAPTTVAAAPSTVAPAGVPAEAGKPEPAGATLADGRHPAYLTAVDVDGGKVTVDVIQFFMGEAAVAEAKADGEPPPENDVLIRNQNALKRTLPVVSGAPITVNNLAPMEFNPDDNTIEHTISLAKLAGYGKELDGHVMWLMVADGKVTKLAEQFMP